MNKVTPFQKLSKDDVLRIMREIIAEDDSYIIWTNHVKEQMVEREISNTQILNCLDKGVVTEYPTYITAKGNWKFTVSHRTAGKDIGVAIGLSIEDRVILITVFEDKD